MHVSFRFWKTNTSMVTWPSTRFQTHFIAFTLPHLHLLPQQHLTKCVPSPTTHRHHCRHCWPPQVRHQPCQPLCYCGAPLMPLPLLRNVGILMPSRCPPHNDLGNAMLLAPTTSRMPCQWNWGNEEERVGQYNDRPVRKPALKMQYFVISLLK